MALGGVMEAAVALEGKDKREGKERAILLRLSKTNRIAGEGKRGIV